MNKSALSPSNLIAAIVVVFMALGGIWALAQSQFASIEKTQQSGEAATRDRERLLLDRIETLETNGGRQAREPVEKATIDAITSAIDKRIDLIQAQITDINRQIAAALIIIDSNASAKKTPPLPP
jgi:hypothetical protein